MKMTMSVIGCGYLGATHAAYMAELGHEALGMDAGIDKVHAPQRQQGTLLGCDLDGSLAKHTASGQLRFHCLLRRGRRVRQPALHPGRHPQQPGADAYDSTPLRESFAVDDTLRPDRRVLGFNSNHSWAEAILRQAFAQIIEAGTPTLITGWATAELAKGAANSFLATKISFINAMAEVCEKSGANAAELANILGRDISIGWRGMRPGLGSGGCLPKDLGGFITRADELDAGEAVGMVREAGAVNARRRQRVIDLAREELGPDLRGKRITISGAAFNPQTDDIRDSPALAVALALHGPGATVTVTDPEVLDNARKLHPELEYAEDPLAAVEDADLLLHLTEWHQFSTIDPRRLATRTTTSKVIDARGTLNTDQWRDAGWIIRTLGSA
ncbi:nucleotide sugar dehydrogenase [Streptomyces microflavus]|uniref:nucleotide sugar dehydrogenase n=1 Tax=Streptomyces microflavus TaxID=1919 RepID=UPI003808EA71